MRRVACSRPFQGARSSKTRQPILLIFFDEMDGPVSRTSAPSSSNAALRTVAALRRRPRLTVSLVLWALGLYLAFLASPPVKLTPQMHEAFKLKLHEAEALVPELTGAEHALMDRQLDVRASQVWFWRLRSPYREQVEAKRPALQDAQRRVAALHQRRDEVLRQAKQALGLWSEAGVEEGRELFW
jgi:hypothetical protein